MYSGGPPDIVFIYTCSVYLGIPRNRYIYKDYVFMSRKILHLMNHMANGESGYMLVNLLENWPNMHMADVKWPGIMTDMPSMHGYDFKCLNFNYK